MNIVNRESNKLGLRINLKKTESMVISKRQNPPACNIEIHNTPIKQVSKFNYLGSIITQDARSIAAIETRIIIAKNAFTNMKSMLTNRNLDITTRTRTLKTYIWSVLLYGSETWTLTQKLKDRLQAAEMWFYRRMLRISWTDRVTNQEVLRRAGTERTLVKEIRKRQLNFLGHVLRKEGVEHLTLTGKIEGKRARGRQRQKFINSLIEDLTPDITPVKLIQLADRLRWRGLTVNVPDTTLR